jgi:hypothetical protein
MPNTQHVTEEDRKKIREALKEIEHIRKEAPKPESVGRRLDLIAKLITEVQA